MSNKIKLLFPNQHSQGRGIGFYAQNLIKQFENHPQLKLVSQNPDLIHYPYFDLFYPSLPLPKPNPTVVTIHDVTPLVLPNLYPQGIRAKLTLSHQKLSLKNTTAILTDSQNSKQDIHKYLNIPQKKIFVTPLAVDPLYKRPISEEQLQKIKQKYQLPDKFILYVGGANPNKNIPSLIKACQKLGVSLILVGSEFTKPARRTFSIKAKLGIQATHPELKQLSIIKQKIKADKSIKALGFVATADLSVIYRLATLYCQPSFYEGFGLPVLEAMTAGCLVVSSNTSSLPEIYPQGNPSFNPRSQESILKTIKHALQLSEVQRNSIIQKAKLKAKNFSWEKTARQTIQVYKQALHL